jgi:hypothetical protein
MDGARTYAIEGGAVIGLRADSRADLEEVG